MTTWPGLGTCEFTAAPMRVDRLLVEHGERDLGGDVQPEPVECTPPPRSGMKPFIRRQLPAERSSRTL